ncbi:MAG: hypothetical protein AB7V16_00695 [Vulcanibacillus sp.]
MNKKYFNFAIVIAILIFIAWFAYNSNNTDEPGVDNPTNIEQNGDNSSDNINNEPQDSEVKTDSGRFTGRIDNNFIEVRISGVPDSIDPKVFMLSDEVKEMFDSLNLNEEDNIKFDYIIDEIEQQIIVKLERM